MLAIETLTPIPRALIAPIFHTSGDGCPVRAAGAIVAGGAHGATRF
jgi:hypothetical protein